MMKKFKSTLIINTIGLLILFVCLFGYQGFMSFSHSLNHKSVVIDEVILKEKLKKCTTKKLEEMLAAGKEIEEWNVMLEKQGPILLIKS